jgi:hypothetical protein
MSAIDSATAILGAATAPTDTTAATTANNTATDTTDTINDAVADSSGEGDAAEGSEGSSGEEDGQGGEAGASTKVPTTAQIRASLKAFRDASPEHAQAAKLLNDGYSRYEAYKAVFPTVDDARTFKTQLDTLGGLEGIANMQSTLANVEETDALLEAGDPKVLDAIFEDSPEGAKKLAGPFLSKLAKLDPETYQKTVQPHFVRSLIDANFPNVLNFLSSKLGDNAEAKGIVDNMKAWFAGQQSQAEKFSSDALSPERDQFQKERETFQSEKRKDFESAVGTVVSSHINSELGSKLRPYAAALNALPVAVRQDVARACISELASSLKADKAYQTQVNAMLNARKPDRDKIIAYNKAKVTSLADTIIAKVTANYSLKPGEAAKSAAARTGKKPGAQDAPKTATNIIKLKAAPKDSDIAWDHPNMSTEAYIRGRAVVRDGKNFKYVSWKG